MNIYTIKTIAFPEQKLFWRELYKKCE